MLPPVLVLSTAFCAGCLWLQTRSVLPPMLPLVALLGASLAVLVFVRGRWRILPLVLCAFLAGAGWSTWRAQLRMADELSSALEGKDLQVEGVIDGLPRLLDRGTGFDLSVRRAPAGVPARLRLAWYGGRTPGAAPPALQAGERWRLRVRLKRPWGNSNPHGNDFAAQMFAQGIGATGYVRDPALAQRVTEFDGGWAHRIERLRGFLRERMESALGDRPWRATLVALAIGEQREVPPEHWTLYSRAGITHLVSISGMHIVLWAVLAGGAAGALWRRWPAAALRMPAQQCAAIVGLIAALAYCAIAGWGVPAQRTVIMLTVAGMGLLAGRSIGAATSLALALLAVLLYDPWAVIGRGFWLSFGAVSLLMLAGAGLLRREQAWRAWWRGQWAIGVGLAVPLLALTGQMSLVAPLANAIAIPVVSFLVLPLVLGFMFLPWPSPLATAHWIFDRLAWLLGVLSAPDWAVWQPAQAPALALAGAMLGAAWLLLPRGVPGRGAGMLLILPLALWSPPRPAPGHFALTVLDVGQGLAVHVQTATHALVFDTGPRYGRESDAGQRVLIPYLRGEGVTRLDALVVSHEDADHSGGAASLVGAMRVDTASASLSPHSALALSLPTAKSCTRGDAWNWDGVRFEFLHPAPGVTRDKQGNTRSCVLRVSVGKSSVLLTADIDKAAEAELLASGLLQAEDVLVAPHHGSRSSSSPDFVAAVRPRWVVFPVGYRSRFGHPHAEIVARYRAAGALVLRSDRDGAVRFAGNTDGLSVQRWRPLAARYWTPRRESRDDEADADAMLDSDTLDRVER